MAGSIRERDAAYGRILAATQGEYATPDGDDRRTLLAALDALRDAALMYLMATDMGASAVRIDDGENTEVRDRKTLRDALRAALAAAREATDGR